MDRQLAEPARRVECRDRVEIAEEGVGLTTIGIDWAPDVDLAGCTTWVQRTGKKREPGFDSLGWAAPIELYRPLLSYDELGGVLDGRPSELYDKLFVLLGLEQITDAQQRLIAALKQLQAPQIVVKGLTAELNAGLKESADPRAAQALALLGKRTPDIAAVQALVTGTATTDSGSLPVLRSTQPGIHP